MFLKQNIICALFKIHVKGTLSGKLIFQFFVHTVPFSLNFPTLLLFTLSYFMILDHLFPRGTITK